MIIFFTRINLRIILKVRYAFIKKKKKRITWDENDFFFFNKASMETIDEFC